MNEIERVIRPIVQGQLRGFAKEHPECVAAVNWYKPREDKVETFVNSVAKRIVRDLTRGSSAARLEAAVLACRSEKQEEDGLALGTGPTPAASGRITGRGWPRFLQFWKPFQ